MGNTAQQIFGKRAAFYATSPTHTDKAVLDRLVALARLDAGMLVLDVGTGTGHTAFALAPHVRRVIATDITPEMLDEGRRLKDALKTQNVEFRIADAHGLPFEEATFDVVTCRRAAHHFTDIAVALIEMKRVLKPGGRLVVDDRSVPADERVDATMNRLDRLHDPSHVREYRPGEWREMLAEAGFEVEAIEPYTKHRPLSSLTANAGPENAAEIEAVIDSLDEAQREAMNVAEKDAETYTNHWFVMAVGVKQDV